MPKTTLAWSLSWIVIIIIQATWIVLASWNICAVPAAAFVMNHPYSILPRHRARAAAPAHGSVVVDAHQPNHHDGRISRRSCAKDDNGDDDIIQSSSLPFDNRRINIYRIGRQTTLNMLRQQQEQQQQQEPSTETSLEYRNHPDFRPHHHELVERAALVETWNWCAQFVVPHNLCPWAAASVAHDHSIQFFFVDDDDSNSNGIDEKDNGDHQRREDHFERALYLASQVFQRQLLRIPSLRPQQQNQNGEEDDEEDSDSDPRLLQQEEDDVDNDSPLLDPKTAIAFVIQLPPSSSRRSSHNSKQQQQQQQSTTQWSFDSFIEWFNFVEDELFDNGLARQEDDKDSIASVPRPLSPDVITWAPFHPDWRYYHPSEDDSNSSDDGSQPDPLCLEKQTPYPTVSIVSTQIINQAGPSATQKIIEHNERMLRQKTLEEWKSIYDKAVRHQNN